MLFTGWEVRIGRNCPRGRGPKYRMKLPTIPPGLADKIVKRPPAPGTNQIAGFGDWRKKIIFFRYCNTMKAKTSDSRVYSVHFYSENTVKRTRPNFQLLDWIDQKELSFCCPTGLDSHIFLRKPKIRQEEKSTGYNVAVSITVKTRLWEPRFFHLSLNRFL